MLFGDSFKNLENKVDSLAGQVTAMQGDVSGTKVLVQEIHDRLDDIVVSMAGGRDGEVSEDVVEALRRTARNVQSRPRRVVAVEDDEALLGAYSRMFSSEGFEFYGARLVREAMGYLRLMGASIDLLIIDYGLPDGTGLDVLRAVRKVWGGAVVPVVMVTGLEGAEFERVGSEVDRVSSGVAVYSKEDALDFLRLRLNNGFGNKGRAATPPP